MTSNIDITNNLIASGIALFFTWWIIPHVMRIVKHKNMMDEPNGQHKLHSKRTPVLGGIGIFLGFLITSVAGAELLDLELNSMFRLSIMLLLFLGIADDLSPIPAKIKLIFQVIIGGIALWGSQAFITDFSGVLGLQTIPILIAIPITLFVMIVIINAYNLIDGIDGLSGMIGVIVSVSFGIIAWLNNLFVLVLLSAAICGSLIGFLIYNIHPARIFMGDTGTLIVGFVIAFLSIELLHLVPINDSWAYNDQIPALVVATLMTPLYDTLRVVMLRLASGRRIFQAGRDHIHHSLLNYGLGVNTVTTYLSVVQILIIMIAASMVYLGYDNHLVLGFSIIFSVVVLPFRANEILLFKLFGWTALVSNQTSTYDVVMEFDSVVERQEDRSIQKQVEELIN